MNIYYTAKDMEELAAKGVTQLEIGPRVFLTDFAYETAEQLEIELIMTGEQTQNAAPVTRTAAPARPQQTVSRGQYNKPSGCQHGGSPRPQIRAAGAGSQPTAVRNNEDGSSVNRLVDIMGKIMKRGD